MAERVLHRKEKKKPKKEKGDKQQNTPSAPALLLYTVYMTDNELYMDIVLSVVGFYILPAVLFFYCVHLFRKYRKKKENISQEEIDAYNKIKEMTRISRD